VPCRIRRRNEESRGWRKKSSKMGIRNSGIMAEEPAREGRASAEKVKVMKIIKSVTV
jgi:hypothetical protein